MVKSSKEDIKENLDMDDGTAPWETLNKGRIPNELADTLEGDHTINELQNTLFNHMDRSSSQELMDLLSTTSEFSGIKLNMFLKMLLIQSKSTDYHKF